MMFRSFFVIVLVILNSCSYYPYSQKYLEFYTHLLKRHPVHVPMEESDYFLVILVDARHLDYTNNYSFLHTVAKHPNGSKTGDVGHAWIYLQGWIEGCSQRFILEGGHSGETGVLQPKYFDGIMNYNDWGYANPTEKQKMNPRYEPNPIKYLWVTQRDGFFEQGPGIHAPTFAAKVNLSREQFHAILDFMYGEYRYSQYALTGQQCSSFVVKIASLAGLSLESQVSMSIEDKIFFRGATVRFWEDPRYSQITFSSPDVIEKSLIQAVKEGRAEYALYWYHTISRK